MARLWALEEAPLLHTKIDYLGGSAHFACLPLQFCFVKVHSRVRCDDRLPGSCDHTSADWTLLMHAFRIPVASQRKLMRASLPNFIDRVSSFGL